MAIFGTVPGLSIFAIGALFAMAISFTIGSYVISHHGTRQRVLGLTTTVVGLFIVATTLVLVTSIAEDGFLTRITGG